MENVLEVYHRPYDPLRPVVCLDESSKQLIGELRSPIPPGPGRVERFDTEYERNGTASIFLACEPLKGRTFTKATEQRCRTDFAYFLQEIVEAYPEAEKIVLVMDNLNTHTLGSLYEAFSPEEAWRLAARLEIHYTPKHGSWLNIAEIELSALSRQCLRRRIPELAILGREVEAWTRARNERSIGVKWQLDIGKARTKLRRLYPVQVLSSEGKQAIKT